jgi:O-antigen ligase
MWVWMKAGIFGFVALLALFAAALMRATQLTLALGSGPMKAAAFSFGAMVLMFLLFSWADLGLVSVRALFMFGMALGGIVAISSIVRSEQVGPAPGA